MVAPAATAYSPEADPVFSIDDHPAAPTESAAAVDPGTAPVTAAAAPEPTPIRDRMASRGYDVSGFASDEELLVSLESVTAQAQQMPQMQRMAQQWQQHLEGLSEQQPATQASPQVAPEQPAISPWGAPEYDPGWEPHVRFDGEAGRYVPKDMHSNPAIADKYNTHRQWAAQRQQELIQDPIGTLSSVMDPHIDQRVQAAIQAHQAEQDAQQQLFSSEQQARQFIAENSKRLFIHDANGNTQADQLGNAMFTPEGQVFYDHMTTAQQLGITDPANVVKYATQLMVPSGHPSQAGQQPAAPVSPAAPVQTNPTAPPPTSRDLFMDRLGNSGRSPNSDATIANAAASGELQNEEADIKSLLAHHKRNAGF
jgi:hypothetical protein